MNTPATKTTNKPQQMGRRQRPKTRYGQQMGEKQTLKEVYGISESQLKRYYTEAKKKRESTGNQLIVLLERRLDNAVYRAGFAVTRPAARQIVSHGFFEVNGRRVTVPSFRVKTDDVVTIKQSKRGKALFTMFPKSLQNVHTPPWVLLNPEEFSFTIKTLPKYEDAQAGVDVQGIVEFLSR